MQRADDSHEDDDDIVSQRGVFSKGSSSVMVVGPPYIDPRNWQHRDVPVHDTALSSSQRDRRGTGNGPLALAGR